MPHQDAEEPAVRAGLLRAVGTAVSAYQESTAAFDAAVAAVLGVGATDLRCLGLIVQEIGPTSPGVLATRLGLTPGSVTPMLDRLERLGYVQRSRDQHDRRKVTVSATDRMVGLATRLYGPVTEDGMRLLEHYTDAELDLVVGFLHQSRRLQDAHTTRLTTTD